jgi:hypothetical protein
MNPEQINNTKSIKKLSERKGKGRGRKGREGKGKGREKERKGKRKKESHPLRICTLLH